MSTMRITADEMHDAIAEIVDGMFSADLLAIPGVYEALAEELNNEAIDLILESEGLGEGDDDEPETCDECGAEIPDDAHSHAGAYHDESCSLHEDEGTRTCLG